MILLHLFATTTLPISHNARNALDAFASAINDSSYRTQMHGMPSITTTATISADNRLLQNKTDHEPHNDLFHAANVVGDRNNDTNEIMSRLFSQQFMQSDRLASSSILYGLLSVAAQRNEKGQCYNDMNQIYEGIQRKEIWAMKGKAIEFTDFGFSRLLQNYGISIVWLRSENQNCVMIS